MAGLGLLLLLLALLAAPGAGRKPAAGRATTGPITPRGEDPHTFCMACKLMVERMNDKTRKYRKTKELESQVIIAMEDLCSDSSFEGSDFPKPKLVRACRTLLGDHEEEFETLFSRNIVKAKDKFNHFCVESIAACRGLDVSALKAPEAVGGPDLDDPDEMAAMAKMMGRGDDDL